jgi:hypothetical protein
VIRGYLQTLRHSWWYRFAHRPLCDRFEGGAFRIGKLRLCRGCTWLWFGVVVGAVVAIGPGVAVPPAAALLAVSLGLSHPRLYRKLPRLLRAALRVSMGAGAALLLFRVVHGELLVPGVAAVVLLALRHVYVRVRAKLKREACEGCPELGAPGVCSGYARQAEAVRAWRDRVEEELNREGAPPPIFTPS